MQPEWSNKNTDLIISLPSLKFFSDCLYCMTYHAPCDLSPADMASLIWSVCLSSYLLRFLLFFDTLSFISKALTMMLSLPVSLFAPSLLSSYLSFKSQIEYLFIRQIWWLDCVPRHVFKPHSTSLVKVLIALLHTGRSPWKQEPCLS